MKYALGEIILVVIGILMALQINNWNEGRKQQQALDNIYAMVAEDLERDIKSIEFIIQVKKKEEPIFKKILDGSMTKKDYEDNPEATKLIFGLIDLPLNTGGYNLLTAFQDNSKTDKDRLPFWIHQFYVWQKIAFTGDNQVRLNDIESNSIDWKNNQSWYADFVTGRDYTEFIAYALNDQDYKNRVANYYLLNHTIYLPILNNYVEGANNLIKEIRTRID
ncbi:MAG: hypothetical protein E4H26_01785 [Flavobacteriales bacterium]|nr:MAG: hypothetical protein E4H26_01785 [Flavobacteriales bacterium]